MGLRILFPLLFLATHAVAELRVSLNPSDPTVGENAVLELKVINEKGNLERLGPTAKTSGYKINWNSGRPSRSMHSVNGVSSHQVSISWNLQPTSTGIKSIPPIQVVIGGRSLTTKALDFQVFAKQQKNFFLIKTKLDRDNVSLGGVAVLDIDICLSDQMIRKVEQSIGSYQLAINHYDDLPLPPSLTNDFHLNIEGRESNRGTWFGAPAGKKIIDGFSYRIERIRMELEPKTSGRLAIPSFSTQFYQLGNFQRNFFRTTFSKIGKAQKIETPTLYLKVSPPPEEGKPSNFQGQVCEKLEAKVVIDDLQTGDTIQLHSPLALTLTLSSDRRGETLQLPDFHNLPAWKDAFDVNTSAMVREDLKNSAVFSGIIVRPKDKNLKAIPAIEAPFFSLIDESYHIAKSEPIPVTIETIDDATLLDDRAVEVLLIEKEEQKKKTVSRLHGLETDLILLKSSATHSLSWAWLAPLVSAIWLAGLFIAWALPSWKANRKNNQASFEGSYVLNSLGNLDTPTQMLDLLSKYLLHQHQCQDPSSFTHTDTQLASDLQSLVSELEQEGYGRQSDGSRMSEKTKSMVQRLEGLK